jgi:hypothetical protein
MRVAALLVSAMACLVACRNDPARPRNGRPPARAGRPDAALQRFPAPTVGGVTTVTLMDGGTITTSVTSSDVPSSVVNEGLRTFRVAASNCIRDPARNALGIGVHGYFGGGRLELEVRNIRYSCTPAPTFSAQLEDGEVHLRTVSANRVALAQCQCRHDQFLQVTGIPPGDYRVVVEEVSAGDAGTVTRLGAGTIVAEMPAQPPAGGAPDAGAVTSSGAP